MTPTADEPQATSNAGERATDRQERPEPQSATTHGAAERGMYWAALASLFDVAGRDGKDDAA